MSRKSDAISSQMLGSFMFKDFLITLGSTLWVYPQTIKGLIHSGSIKEYNIECFNTYFNYT